MNLNPEPDKLYCRFCLDNTLKLPNYVDLKLNKCEIHDKIVELFQIKIDDPELSKLICLPCRDQIQDFIAYMETVAKNQELLQETKNEVFIKVETDDDTLDDNKNETTYISYSGMKVEVIEGTPLLTNSPLETTINKENTPEESKRSGLNTSLKDDIEKIYTCDYCKTKLMTKKALVSHMRDHTKHWYKCDKCEDVLTSANQLRLHKKEKHPKNNKLTGGKIRYYDKIVDISNYLFCELCEGNPKFETFDLMHEHYMAEHGVRGYVLCCNSVFRTQRSVVVHCDRHLAPVDYMCKICQKILPTKPALKDHLDRHKPDEEKIHECDTCHHRFSRASHLTHHLKITHNKVPKDRVACGLCNKTCSTKYLLDQHIQRVHEIKKELPWVCETCGKRCFSDSDLRSHVKYKHSVGVNCNLCGNFVKNLAQHLRRHEQNKLDLKCDVCSRSIPTYYALKQHMKSHEEKQFRCETCGEYFGRKIALKDHMSQHDGIPRHFCDYCERTFNNSGNKYKHIKQAHYEELERKRIMREQNLAIITINRQ